MYLRVQPLLRAQRKDSTDADALRTLTGFEGRVPLQAEGRGFDPHRPYQTSRKQRFLSRRVVGRSPITPVQILRKTKASSR